ncbi:MAG: hypothetical protein HY720_27215, partial [Planctomycetes bacterium]|nr:hypothetical protein [Planctomycetota bacterium]
KNLLVFGNRAEETAAGLRTAPVASLASSKTYQAAVGESGSDSILLAYGDGQKFFSALRGVLDLDDQQEFDKVDAYVGFSEIEWARISCNLADGRLVNETVVAFPEDAILRTFAPKPAPLDADLVLLAGGAGTMFLSVDDLPGYWERVKGHLLEQEKTLGGRDLAEGLEEFEKGMGRSLEEILSLVDGRIAVGLPSMSEMMETDRAMDGEKEVRDFPVGFAARLADPAKAGEFIDWLFKEGPLSEGVERLEPETADGVTIHGFVIDDTRLRYAIDGNHLVVGGSGIKEAFARARSPEAEKMKAALAERFARLGAPGFLGYSSGGVGSGGMGGMMFFMLMARSRAMWAEGMATIERKAKVLRIRQPIQTGSSELDGTIRFAPLGLVGRSVAALDAGGLRASAGDILRMTWREDVDGCMQSLAMLHNLVQLYRQNNEKWPATLADAMSQEEHRWWMRGCPEVEGSNQNPGSAYTYIAEKPAGLSDEGALWIYESEERHPFGRACLFRDSTVRFLYSDEFEKTLAKQK